MKPLNRWARALGVLTLITAVTASGIVATAVPAEAAVVRPFTARFDASIFGDFLVTGNGSVICPNGNSPVDPFGTPTASCAGAQDGTNTAAADINDSFYMRWADVDASAATFNSSQSTVTIPAGATVAFARLSWSGDTGTIRLTDGTVSAAPGCNTRQFLAGAGTAVLPSGTPESTSVHLAVGPAAATAFAPQVISRDPLASVPASQPQFYSASADVTAQFAGSTAGTPLTVSVGNVWSPQGFGCYAGWSLTLVYASDAPSTGTPQKRRVVVYDGHVRQASTDAATTVTTTGFAAAAPGSRLAVTAYEGDRNIAGDQLLVNGAAIAEPGTGATTNYFVSRTDGASSPAVANNMSVDAQTVDAPIPVGATSAEVRLATIGDTFLATTIALSVPIASLGLTTSVSPAGPVLPGEMLNLTNSVTAIGGAAADLRVESSVDACDRDYPLLASGATQAYSCAVTAGSDDFTVTHTATATGAAGALSGSTTTPIDVIHPAIDVTLSADQPRYTAGQTVTLTVSVENTGDVPLTDVSVIDTAVPGCARHLGTLPTGPAEAVTYSCTTLAPVAGDAHSVSATGRYLASRTFPVGDASSVAVPTVGSVSGRVFADRNNNGSVDAGEFGISGVIISLSGTTATGDPLNRSTSTARDGGYAFDNVPAGAYRVTETQPAAYDDGLRTAGSSATLDAGDSMSVLLTPGQSSTGSLFGERPTGSLSGSVFVDVDADGLFGPSEPGLGGARIVLSGADADGNPVSLSTTTGSGLGQFEFEGLRPGSYALDYARVAGHGAGPNTAGSAGGTLATDARISDIELSARTTATGYLFANTRSSLSGAVYIDADNDGVRAVTEQGAGGVTVTLRGTDPAGAITPRTTLTNSDGSYAFDGLLAGDFAVTVTPVAGYGDAVAAVGSAGGTAGVNEVRAVPLGAGAHASGYLFALGTASLAGTVFHDIDGSGTVDAAENGLPGVTIELSGTSVRGDSVRLSTASLSDGSFAFGGLAAGNYQLRSTQPSGFTAPRSITGIALGAGEQASGYLFGAERGSIGGRVWLDTDEDGVADTAEPGVGGIPVALYAAGAPGGGPLATQQTDADGRYRFGDLAAGDYQIRVDPGASRVLSPRGAGNPATGSDIDPATGRSDTLTVDLSGGATTAHSGVDAGVAPRVDALAIALTAGQQRVTVGDTFAVGATVSNVGNSTADGVLVTVTLPAGLEFAAPPLSTLGLSPLGRAASVWTCAAVGQSATCSTTAPLPRGESIALAPLTAVARATSAGSITATATFAHGGAGSAGVGAVAVAVEAAVTPPVTPPVVVVPPGGASTPSAVDLARTGPDAALAVPGALALLTLGLLVLVLRRRRTAA